LAALTQFFVVDHVEGGPGLASIQFGAVALAAALPA
jgi:hypothetical protein